MRVGLLRLNGTMSLATLQSNDELDSIDLCVNEDGEDVECCLAAAKLLEDLAQRFRKLSLMPHRMKQTTQDRINKL